MPEACERDCHIRLGTADVRGEPRRLQQHLAPGRRQPEQQFPETDDPPSHGFSGTGIGARVAAALSSLGRNTTTAAPIAVQHA
jgi:hypothetical protein